MALDPIQKTILETTEKLIESNKKTQDKIEKAAQGDGRKKTTKIAIATLKKQEEIRKGQINLFGVSKKRLDKADKLGVSIQAQEKVIAEQKKIIEDSGQDASGNKELNKLQYKLDKDKDKRSKFLGSASAEDSKKEGATNKGILGYLKDTAGFLGGIAKQGMQKVKSGLGGFSKFLFGALAVAALAFLDHPKFKEMVSLLVDTLIPLAVTFYEKVLVPVGAALKKLFEDVMLALKGEKSLMSVLMDNKLAILGVVAALAPALTFGLLMSSSKLLIGAVMKFGGLMKASFLKQLAINALAGGGKAGVLGTMKALGTTMLKFTGIAALIYAAVVGIFQGAKDAYAEFQATGSIFEAIKTFLVSFLANAAGAILNPIKDGISWILGKIGSVFGIESFTNASKVLDDFSIVDMMKDMLTFLGDSISGVFDGFMQVIQDFLRSGALGFLGGDIAADKLFGTKEEQVEKIKAKEEEQAANEFAREFEKEQQKLEKAKIERKKLEKLKAEQNALQPKAPANLNLKVPSAAAGAGSNIISAPTSVVNANSSSHTSTSTPVRQPNMVIGQLASSY